MLFARYIACKIDVYSMSIYNIYHFNSNPSKCKIILKMNVSSREHTRIHMIVI